MRKYILSIDRVSAYEILNDKIKAIEKQAAEKAAREELQKEKIGQVKKTTRKSSGRRRTATSPVVKVLTSATFIRGVMGILSKAIK